MPNRFCFTGGVVFAATAVLALNFPARAIDAGDENDDENVVSSGQRRTPTAAPRADLQYLNVVLSQYPDFVASGCISSTRPIARNSDFRSSTP